MLRNTPHRRGKAASQRGTTLIIALVLLLLATLLALFAMHVGTFSQRSSAADLRARIMHQTLESALSQGIEYIRNNTVTVQNLAMNNLCQATDTSYPCGAVTRCATATVDSKGNTYTDSNGYSSDGQATCTGDLIRRGHMYYYTTSTGAGYDVNGNGSTDDNMDLRSLPIGTLRTTSVDGFTVDYGVGVVMCMVKKPNAVTDPTECTIDTTKAQGTYIFTVTAAGNISGESTGSTLSTAFGLSPKAPGITDSATLIASGGVDLTGNGTLVTNPDAGGNGLPITVWTPACAKTHGAGTVDSCYLEDWLRSSKGSYSFATNSDGTTSTVPICSGSGNVTCSCSQTLSSGSGGLIEGIDVLSNDSKIISGVCPANVDPPVYGVDSSCVSSPSSCKANYDVQQSEFPKDLFQYIFNVSAWSDNAVQSPGTADSNCDGGNDCFGEYHDPTTATVADGSTQTMGYDEKYLYSLDGANYILPTAAHQTWVSSQQLATDCNDLITKGSAKGGIIWDQTGSCLAGATQIGYPDKPVILVSDGNADLQGAIMYGMLFVRDTTPAGQSTPNYGGAATFVGHSTGTIYGSVVVQGPAAKLNGSSAIVYNGTVLNAFKNLPGQLVASPVPGAWTDRYAY